MSAAAPVAPNGIAARRRRAWLLGTMLFLGLLAAAALVAWGDLEVRRDSGQRYVQTLADSHAREVGHVLSSLEADFRGLADALAAIRIAAPDAATPLIREAMSGISRRNPAVVGLRREATAPDFVPEGGAVPRSFHLGLPAPDADGAWLLPVAMLLPPTAAERARWLRGELDVDVFSNVLRVHDVGDYGIASVLGHDGTLLARSDTGVLHAGLRASGSPVIPALRHAPGGVLQSRSRLDGVTRVVGYRTVEGRPLVATVGIPPEVLHAGWWPFVATLALGVVLLMSAWGAGLYFLRRAGVWATLAALASSALAFAPVLALSTCQ